jgi:cyanophycin synthetase
VFDEHPFKVILDYAHNPAAAAAMGRLVSRLEVKGRRCLVASVPGDRRDEDIVGVARASARHFAHYICRRDDKARGRGPLEVPQMLRQGLVDAGVDPDCIEIIESEEAANESALRMARTGDLVLVLADNIARSWKQIIYFKPGSEVVSEAAAARAVVVPEEFLGSFELDGDVELIRDERGVRIAREADD